MKRDSQSRVEIRDVAAGLWIWRLEHPHWKPGRGWEPIVASTCVDSGGERLVIDPLAPPPDAVEVSKSDFSKVVMLRAIFRSVYGFIERGSRGWIRNRKTI